MTDGMSGDLRVNPRDLKDVVCEACGNYTFDSVFLLKKIPAFLTGRGKEALLPRPVFSCHACGHINREFLVGYLPAPAEEPDATDTQAGLSSPASADTVHTSREESPPAFTLFKPDGTQVRKE